MGQKVNPQLNLELGVIKDWDSKWYAEADFADCLVEDHKIRVFLKKVSAWISKIEIERASDRVKIIIYTAKPGVVIGKGGAEIEKLKAEVQKMTSKKVFIDIKEVRDGPRRTVSCRVYCTAVREPCFLPTCYEVHHVQIHEGWR